MDEKTKALIQDETNDWFENVKDVLKRELEEVERSQEGFNKTLGEEDKGILSNGSVEATLNRLSRMTGSFRLDKQKRAICTRSAV